MLHEDLALHCLVPLPVHVNEKMVTCVLLDTVNAFPFIALCEISFNHFNSPSPEEKEGKLNIHVLEGDFTKRGRLQENFCCAES